MVKLVSQETRTQQRVASRCGLADKTCKWRHEEERGALPTGASSAQRSAPTRRHGRDRCCAGMQQTFQTSHTFGSVSPETVPHVPLQLFLEVRANMTDPTLEGPMFADGASYGKERRKRLAGGSWRAGACEAAALPDFAAVVVEVLTFDPVHVARRLFSDCGSGGSSTQKKLGSGSEGGHIWSRLFTSHEDSTAAKIKGRALKTNVHLGKATEWQWR